MGNNKSHSGLGYRFHMFLSKGKDGEFHGSELYTIFKVCISRESVQAYLRDITSPDQHDIANNHDKASHMKFLIS